MQVKGKIIKFAQLAQRCLYYCGQAKKLDEEQAGTQYSNWVLARAAGHNHNVAHLKRKFPKDRYSIHRLTNLNFMCDLVIYGYKYNLNHNEKIVLLAQFNHVMEVLGKSQNLVMEIFNSMKNPPDLIWQKNILFSVGTLMSSFVTMGNYSQQNWLLLIDDILVQKFDEDYDELFGMIIGLHKYKENLKLTQNYLQVSKDLVIHQIPIIYRNSLDVLRQYVTQNIYNLKECRLLFEALYQAGINQSYFWDSVRDWFNIYTKEQLCKKQFDQYFIMKESAVEKVLHDHGIIRPRPILQELSSIVYILSEFGNISWRFIQFAQDLILYAIENGSNLYKQFQQIYEKQEQQFAFQSEEQKLKLNQHIQITKQSQKQQIKQMEKKYRTIFINPISLKNNFVVNLLVVLSRAYKQYNEPKEIRVRDENKGLYDKKNQVYLDPRVKRWLLLQLVKTQMQYTVKQLLQIHRCLNFLKDSQINIEALIAEKLVNLRSTDASFAQIEQLMEILPLLSYDKLNMALANFLNKNHPSEILNLTKLIEKKNLWPYVAQYMLRLPKAVNTHEKYFSFEENCYFILMLLQNSDAINSITCNQNLRYEYDSQMETLKQSIKTITYGRGFKLAVNSYFHKIMEYIDVVQFFEGGRA